MMQDVKRPLLAVSGHLEMEIDIAVLGVRLNPEADIWNVVDSVTGICAHKS